MPINLSPAAIRAWALVAASSIMLSACTGLGAPPASPSSVPAKPSVSPSPVPSPAIRVFSRSDSPITVRTGEEFGISLSENRTTAYRWAIVEGTDQGTVELLGDRYVSPTPDPVRGPLIGAGGTTTWRFRAQRSGQVSIRWRLAEQGSGGRVQEEMVVEVIVQP